MTINTPVGLTFDQTVPRAIVHRRAVGEVLITDSAQVAEDEFLLAVQIPRAHSLWADSPVAYHDPFATGEAARQGSLVVVHRYVGVPVDLPGSMQRYGLTVSSLDAYRDNERSPLEGVLRYRLSDKQLRGGQLSTMRICGELVVDGVQAMRFSGDVVFMSRADYLALRAFQRSRKPIEPDRVPDQPKPLHPAAVGRMDQRNVVIGAPIKPDGQLRYPLVVDLRHPSFFDHGYDHVPGPFCVEGLRQAAIVTAYETGAIESPIVAITGCKVKFADFGEFEEILTCSAEVMDSDGGRVTLRASLHQFGKQLLSGEIELRQYP